MSGLLLWVIMAVLFTLLWWAGFYATKDMRVRKNAMREEQAKRNLELHAQQQLEEKTEADAVESKATSPAADTPPKDGR